MLAETVNNIINTNRERKLKKIQKRIDEMSEQWWNQYWKRVYEMTEYYSSKPDKKAREKVISLEAQRIFDIYEGYRNILKQSQNIDFDIDIALEELKSKIAVYDNDIEKWKKSFCYYKGCEKYKFRGK